MARRRRQEFPLASADEFRHDLHGRVSGELVEVAIRPGLTLVPPRFLLRMSPQRWVLVPVLSSTLETEPGAILLWAPDLS